MKYTVWLLVIGVLATGCNQPRDKNSKPEAHELGTAAAQRDKALTASKVAAQSVRVYAYAERDEFIDAANRELSDIQTEMERLRRAIARSSGAARADAEAKLEVVSDKWAAARAELKRAEAATEASWDDVQIGYRTARSDLKRSFDNARQWLSDRIEP
jgi:hypothetical protein